MPAKEIIRAKFDAQKERIAAQKAKIVAKLGETREKCKGKYARCMAAAREFDQKISHKNVGREAGGICPYCKRPLDVERPPRVEQEQPTHIEQPPRVERPPHVERPPRIERPPRTERPPRVERPPGAERPPRTERPLRRDAQVGVRPGSGRSPNPKSNSPN